MPRNNNFGNRLSEFDLDRAMSILENVSCPPVPHDLNFRFAANFSRAFPVTNFLSS